MRSDHALKILILDDDETLCRGLAEALADDRWSISTAFDPAMARRIFLRENHDVVITDICLTGSDDDEGLSFLAWIKTLNPVVEVIVMSGYGTSRREREARKLGGYRFFHKPLDTTILHTLLTSLSERRTNIHTAPELHRGPMSDEEAALLQRRYLEGDDASFKAMIFAYRPLIFSIATSWFKLDSEEAKDIFQAVSLEVFLKISRIRRLRPFIVGTAMNFCRISLKSGNRRAETAPNVLPAPHSDPAETSLDIREGLARLSALQRSLIEGMFFEGLSYREISERLGIPIGSVGPTRRRALERLKTYLTR